MSIKIVVTGDNHLNAYTSKMRPAQLEERRRRLKENFQKTIDFSLENKADLYFNVGDLFDMPDPKNDSLVSVAEGLFQLGQAGIKSFLIGGSHDTPKGNGVMPQLVFGKQENVYIFKEQNHIEKIALNIRGTEITIAGITPNPLSKEKFNPSFNLKKQSKLNILMVHCGLTLPPDRRQVGLDFFDSSPFNYIFAGHTHNHNDFYDNGRLFIIPGATEKLTFSEEPDCRQASKEPGFYYLEIGENKEDIVKFIPLSFQKRRELLINFNTINKDDPNRDIVRQLEEVSDSEQMLRLKLVGNINREVYQKIKFHHIWKLGVEKNFYFEIDRQNFDILNKMRQPTRHGRLSQREEIGRIAEEMQREVNTKEEKEIIEDAKKLVIERLEAIS